MELLTKARAKRVSRPPEGKDQLLHAAALPLFLQWCIQKEAKVVFRLASCSSTMCAVIMQHCKGLMAAVFCPHSQVQVEHFSRWLRKYALLLKSLKLQQLPWDTPVAEWLNDFIRAHLETETEKKVAMALLQYQHHWHHTDEQQRALPLQSFEHEFASSASSILQALSTKMLLHLSLSQSSAAVNQPFILLPTDSLAGFTRLASLTLEIDNDQLQSVVPALPDLQCLTRLYICSRATIEQLRELEQVLPRKLAALTLLIQQHSDSHNTSAYAQQPIQLQHLNALTQLHIGNLQPSSQLPPRLRMLCCTDCPEMQPLLSCKQLQQLQLGDSTAPAAELLQLCARSLPALTCLQLRYVGGSAADAAAPAWSGLSCLQDLEFVTSEECIPAKATWQSLQHLVALTRLSITCYDTTLPLTALELSHIIRRMTALHELECDAVGGVHLVLPSTVQTAAAAAQQVNMVEGDLPVVPQQDGNVDQMLVAQAAVDAAAGQQQQQGIWQQVAQQEVQQEVQQVALAQAGDAAAAALSDDDGGDGDNSFDMEQDDTPDMLPVTTVVATLPRLVSLKLRGSGLNMDTVEPLTALTQLTRLTIAGSDFNDAAFVNLAMNLTRLRRISVADSEHVTDASLVVIAKTLMQLTGLKLDGCSVTDSGVRKLSSLTNLRALYVRNNNISPAAYAAALGQQLDGNTSVVSFEVCDPC